MVEKNPHVPVSSDVHGFFAPPNGGLAVEGKKWEPLAAGLTLNSKQTEIGNKYVTHRNMLLGVESNFCPRNKNFDFEQYETFNHFQ